MSAAIELLCRALSHRDRLSESEVEILSSLSQRPAVYPKGGEIIAEQSRPAASCLLVGGLAARAISQPDGGRQLTALQTPGDFVDLHGLLLKTMDHSVMALSECSVVFVPHEELLAITERAPHLTRLLWLSTTIDAAVQRKMTALLGRHTPLQRLGHLICEIYLRLESVGHASDGSFRFPITQAELADIMGLSLVHTNRTVQDLRATNLVTWQNSSVSIADFDRLSRFVGFDPTYLCLRPEPR